MISRATPALWQAAHLPAEQLTTVFLDARNEVLLKRFSETRRKHPLSDNQVGLKQAIEDERGILEPVAQLADFTLDTSNLLT